MAQKYTRMNSHKVLNCGPV